MFAKLVNTDNYENRCMIKENIERCYENNKSCFENSQIHPIGVLKHHQCFRTPKVACVTLDAVLQAVLIALYFLPDIYLRQQQNMSSTK